MTFDDLFTLTRTGTDRWTAPGAPFTDERCVFGGLVIGQAIVAASVQTRRCHAIHAFFIGMGAKGEPFEIAVERKRDGGSFSTRHVEICQGERLLLTAYSSHHDGNDGPQHQAGMPDVPGPDGLENWFEANARQAQSSGKPPRQYLANLMLEVRAVPPLLRGSNAGDMAGAFWMRSLKPILGGPSIHQAAIAFASDLGPVRAGLQQHSKEEIAGLQTASLDHSLWFHREAAFEDWMLYVLRSPVATNGRGLSLGSIFTRDGSLVASVAQEFLARRKQH